MALFSKWKTVNRVVLLPIAEIVPNPNQPRRQFSEEELDSLAASIQQNGLLQPISVRRNETIQKFELIAGERRLMACQSLGWTEINALVVEINEESSAMLALIENIQRQDLSFFEEAQAYRALISRWGLTQEQVAHRLGKAQSTVANKLRLLNLSEPVQEVVAASSLSERHARALLKAEDPKLQLECARTAAARGMTVAQTESYVEKRVNQSPEAQTTLLGGARVFIVRDFRIFVNSMSRAVQVMRGAGIHADSYQTEQDGYVEYVVRVPKSEVQYQKPKSASVTKE